MTLPYYEKLPCGGILTILNNKWFIQYSFLPLDPGGGNISIIIESTDIDNHLIALRNNFELFKSIEHNCDECIYGIPAYMNMTINVHGPSKGVCLEGYYRPISTEKEFQLVKDSFLYAKEKAMELLKNKSTN